MIEESLSNTALTYVDAIAMLGRIGVFTSGPLFRDGHTTAIFAASSIDVTGSTFTQREVSRTGSGFSATSWPRRQSAGSDPPNSWRLEWPPYCRPPKHHRTRLNNVVHVAELKFRSFEAVEHRIAESPNE